MIKLLPAVAVICVAALAVPAGFPNSSAGGASSAPQRRQSKSQKEAEKDKAKAGKLLCTVIGSFLLSAPGGFSDIKSSRDFDASNAQWVAYESAVTFPGARHCTVFTDRETGENTYVTCRMAIPPDKMTGDAFKKWNLELINAIKPCLPKSWTPHVDDQHHPDGYFSMEEDDPGPRIEVALETTPGGKPKEMRINFYRR
ncbi:MAG TPA: hypothetical protein VLZ81_15140 [Blastocatellia bacterium]|nr:hypothetical protein [Blastocatellia bacterium]